MLCLTRRLKESIRIGDDIEIVIVDIKAGSVKLGINVPDHIRVMRTELLERDRNAAVIRGEVKSPELPQKRPRP
jgi:carbon storage regulator